MRPVLAVKAIIVVVFTSTLIRCVSGANLTVGGASGWDLNSNMQDWSSTATFNVGDDLGTYLNLSISIRSYIISAFSETL
jgi:hypothetical protein